MMALLRDKKRCFEVISINTSLVMLFSSVVVVYFFLESLEKLESDYRNNLRKLQGDDREVNVSVLDNKLHAQPITTAENIAINQSNL